MPDLDGISLLKEWSEDEDLPCPVIMMSGHGTVETAVEATRLGAYDFIEKPLSMAKLLLTVGAGAGGRQAGRENIGLKRRTIIALSRSAAANRHAAPARAGQAHRPARHLGADHRRARQRPGDLRPLPARPQRPPGSALRRSRRLGRSPAVNATRELFGTEQGGHDPLWPPGAGRRRHPVPRRGRGHGPGEPRPSCSAPWIRVPSCASAAPNRCDVDVRLVAATQRNLEEEVRAGRFREDLFYHLNVVPLSVPPLRDHIEDIPELLNYYVDYFVDPRKAALPAFQRRRPELPAQLPLARQCPRTQEPGPARADPWGGDEIYPGRGRKCPGGPPPATEPQKLEGLISFNQPLREAREQFEKTYLEYQLDKYGGNVSKMAKEVGHGAHPPLPQAALPGDRDQGASIVRRL